MFATINDAEVERERLVAIIHEVEPQLSKKRYYDEKTGRILSQSEYSARRDRLVEKKGQVVRQLQEVKRWIKDYYRDTRLSISMPEHASLQDISANLLKDASSMIDLARAYVEEIRQLQRENETLRKRLSEYETVQSVSPGSGVDHWRMQTEPQLKGE